MTNQVANDLAPVMTAEELFEFLRIGSTAGYLALNRGDFPFAVKIGSLWRIPRDAMLDWLSQAKAAGAGDMGDSHSPNVVPHPHIQRATERR